MRNPVQVAFILTRILAQPGTVVLRQFRQWFHYAFILELLATASYQMSVTNTHTGHETLGARRARYTKYREKLQKHLLFK